MSFLLIDGKKVADEIKNQIKEELDTIKNRNIQNIPGLVVILVGKNPASEVYVNMKKKVATELGINSIVEKLPDTVSEEFLISTIQKYNNNTLIHGILIQLPLPNHINEFNVLKSINPKKDVDGFHPENIGKLSLNKKTLVPCTPYGIIKLLEKYNIAVQGKNIVIIGRSNIVGKPLGMLMLNNNATVTICHSYTRNLELYTKNADIIIVAIGIPKFLTKKYIKKDTTIIDVGINRVNGHICGDVDFEDVAPICSAITPVPKGVGPMTIAMLMMNTVEAYKNIEEIKL